MGARLNLPPATPLTFADLPTLAPGLVRALIDPPCPVHPGLRQTWIACLGWRCLTCSTERAQAVLLGRPVPPEAG